MLRPTRDYLCNHLISLIPHAPIRMAAYRLAGLKIGAKSIIFTRTEFIDVHGASIGERVIIGGQCFIDCRGGLKIGNNVNISGRSILVAGTHDLHSRRFEAAIKPIVVHDRVWICTGAIILPGMTLGEGAVVGAGSIVTKDVRPFSIVAGNPAKPIGERNSEVDYELDYFPSWV